ncbi:hypothetical protein BHE74_00055256 [Ensete ventricosum]|nr:hypothetical protein BHE74_00055256 [Ensete ventricosum]
MLIACYRWYQASTYLRKMLRPDNPRMDDIRKWYRSDTSDSTRKPTKIFRSTRNSRQRVCFKHKLQFLLQGSK